jgi:hypothetical protein
LFITLLVGDMKENKQYRNVNAKEEDKRRIEGKNQKSSFSV